MSSARDFEWARTRLLREKSHPTQYQQNRASFLVNDVARTNGDKAARELAREFNSKQSKKSKYRSHDR